MNNITYTQLINLFGFSIIFLNWEEHHIDYLKEKYYRFFNKLPDKISDKRLNDFDINSYIKKWNFNLSKDDLLILIVYDEIQGIISKTPTNLIKKYLELFSNFNSIVWIKTHNYLHAKLREVIRFIEEKFKDELLPYKRYEIISKIRKKISTQI